MSRILCVGEAVLDVTDHGSVRTALPGGSGANQAVALARLGRDVSLATCWAADANGDVLARHVSSAGVRLAGDPHTVARTPSALVSLGSDGQPSYDLDVDWRMPDVADGLGDLGETVLSALVMTSYAVVLDGHGGPLDALLDGLDRAASATMRVHDVNVRAGVTGVGEQVRHRVDAVARRAHVVKASEEDIAELWPDTSEAELVAGWLGAGVAAVAITRGERGASLLRAAGRIDVPGVAVQVVDTVGAGDTFVAALVDGLIAVGLASPAQLATAADDALAPVLARACAAAAIACARPGCQPPRAEELPRISERSGHARPDRARGRP